MFSECELLESLDITDWDTSLIQNMACMFEYCTSLSSLDISRWNTGCVRSMSHMFCGCESLESIDISCWNTERVRSMASMFCLCERLKTLDISRWKTGQVRDMESMFYCCLSLESLDISGWDTGMVENISRMFWHCTSLSSLDLSGWNTSRVEKMCGTFCMNETEWHSGLISENNLVSLDVSGWDTSNVRKMPWLFRGCSFSSIDLSSWDTGKVEDMTAMFWGCKNLVRADVSRWNTSNVAERKELFRYCCRLVSVDLTGWDISNVRSSFDFFLGDTALNYDPWTEHPGKIPDMFPGRPDSGKQETFLVARAMESQKYILINEYGEKVSDGQWDRLEEFREGMAVFGDNGGCGIVDTSGNIRVPCGEWDEITDFFNGFAVVRKNFRYTFLDHSCAAIAPCMWEEVRPFREEAAAVKRGGKWGFIDTSGQLIIPCTWDAVSDFYDGAALADDESGTCVLSREGNVMKRNVPISALSYMKDPDNFRYRRRFAATHYENYSGMGLLDMYGNAIIPCRHNSVAYEGYWKDGNLLKIRDVVGQYRTTYYYADIDGKEYHPYPWCGMEPFRDGLALVWTSSRTIFEPISLPPYYCPIQYNPDLPYVELEDDRSDTPSVTKYGYINCEGELVIPCEFDSAGNFYDGYARVEKDGKEGYIDTSGRILYPGQPNPEIGADFFRKPVRIYENGYFGFLGTDGRKLTESKWKRANEFSEGYAAVKDRNTDKWGILNSEGNLSCPYRWEWIGDFHRREE